MTRDQYNEHIRPVVTQLIEACDKFNAPFLFNVGLTAEHTLTIVDLREERQPTESQVDASIVLKEGLGFAIELFLGRSVGEPFQDAGFRAPQFNLMGKAPKQTGDN